MGQIHWKIVKNDFHFCMSNHCVTLVCAFDNTVRDTRTICLLTQWMTLQQTMWQLIL